MKKSIFWAMMVLMIVAMAAGVVASMYEPSGISPVTSVGINPLFKVGQVVKDTAGNEWVYEGKIDAKVVGWDKKGTPTKMLVGGRVLNIIDIEEEEINGATVMDHWGLVFEKKTGRRFKSEVGPCVPYGDQGMCNITMVSVNGGLECAKVYCGD